MRRGHFLRFLQQHKAGGRIALVFVGLLKQFLRKSSLIRCPIVFLVCLPNDRIAFFKAASSGTASFFFGVGVGSGVGSTFGSGFASTLVLALVQLSDLVSAEPDLASVEPLALVLVELLVLVSAELLVLVSVELLALVLAQSARAAAQAEPVGVSVAAEPHAAELAQAELPSSARLAQLLPVWGPGASVRMRPHQWRSQQGQGNHRGIPIRLRARLRRLVLDWLVEKTEIRDKIVTRLRAERNESEDCSGAGGGGGSGGWDNDDFCDFRKVSS